MPAASFVALSLFLAAARGGDAPTHTVDINVSAAQWNVDATVRKLGRTRQTLPLLRPEPRNEPKRKTGDFPLPARSGNGA